MGRYERVVIFANGECRPPKEVQSLVAGRTVVCADGGTLHALRLGLSPAVVIGDLDSLPSEVRARLEAAGTTFLAFPRDKDYTDLELALRHAVDNGARDILLLGLLGGRLDQTLANIFLLALPDWEPARLWFVADSDTGYLVRGGDVLVLRGHPGDIVSLIPITPTVHRVTTQGLRWPLHDATLHFGHTLTISNEMVAPQAEVQVGEGKMVVVKQRVTIDD